MRQIFRHKKVIFLTLMLIVITFLIACVSIYLLYQNAQKDIYNRLSDIVNRERFFTQSLLRDNPGREEHLIGHLKDSVILGQYGEIIYGKEVNDSIYYFIFSNLLHKKLKISKYDVERTTLMLKAIKSKSGYGKETDYLGNRVFAAYISVPELKWGIVAKIPVSEVNKPYYLAIIIVFVLALVLISISIVFLTKITNPIIDNLIRNEKELRQKNAEYACINEQLRKTNDELSLAKEKAEESDRLKTSFLQNISHEIRTPMNAIIGFSDFLEDADLSYEKRTNYIQIIRNSSKQLLNIISDILAIAAIETKQEKINTESFLINELIKELFNDYTELATNRNIKLTRITNADDKNLEIKTDKFKLKQIFTNLLNNAFKFTKNGTIEFGYTIVRSGWFEFFVKDSGIGIEKEKQKRIFDRFKQADDNLNKKYGGTGLGLSIAKAYVEMLGGTIRLESEENQGAMFVFSIPFK